MLASERLATTGPGAAGINGMTVNTKHPGVTQILKPGRAVKIYVIDPRKFQERLEKYVGGLKGTGPNRKETKLPAEKKEIQIKSSDSLNRDKDRTAPDPSIIQGGSSTTTNGNTHGSNLDVEVLKSEVTPKKIPAKKRKAKKRKVVGVKKPRKESYTSEEKEGAAELAFLMKETTTRLGRVSKSSTAVAIAASQPDSPVESAFSSGQNSSVPSPSPSVSSVNSQGQRVKKREPPEMFRCQTCRKVYLGHTKFNLHFQRFPDHQKTVPEVRDPPLTSTQPSLVQINEGHNANINNNSYSSKLPSMSMSAAFLTNEGRCRSTTSRNNAESQTDSIHELANSPKCSKDSSTDSPNQFLERMGGIGLRKTTSFEPTSIRRISTINPDTLSDNCSSPKLPEYTSSEVQSTSERIYNSSEMDPVFLQVSSPSKQSEDDQDLQPITVPDLCLPLTEEDGSSSVPERSEYFNFQTDFNSLPEISQLPSELIGNASCSRQSFNINSLDNLLTDSNSQSPIFSKTSPSPSPPIRLHPRNISTKAEPLIPSSCATKGSNFFTGTAKCTTTTTQNSNPSSFHTSSDGPNIPRTDDDSRDVSINGLEDSHHETENSLDGCEVQIQSDPSPTSVTTMKRKSIWEFVKEQIRMCGINQACGEISEMAEKLSKVARDKFYPIREEEIERLGGTPPIIQVETPFISHLLDLPFGTYIFKEDGGIRKIIPPPTPVSSDLSLTGGVEVDIDKFLSPDIDLISLPHLTNLDFAALCND